ncbi:LysR family transcriptional regulator [Stappia sp.]|uniref:LysR family transcriptional regulator n=1 Tax=Stappia sp. TaxID=1870903 RepID=UPI0032D8BC6A
MSALPPIDVSDLRVLVSLAAEHHFARAAQACNLSQPALSARIRRMEQALGTPLVKRGHRFLGFTEAGERVLARARRVLADLDGLAQDVTGGAELAGRLRLAAIPSAAPLAGRLAAALGARHPLLETVCTNLSSRRIEMGLNDFSVDAGLTYLNNEPLAHVDTLPLMPERYALVSGTPFSDDATQDGGGPIGWAQAARWPLALLTPDMQNRRILDRAFAEADARPQVVFESTSFLSILGRLRPPDTPIVAILPALIVEQLDTRGLHVRPLAPMKVQPVIGLVAPKRELHLPSTSALWRVAAEIAEGAGGDLIT